MSVAQKINEVVTQLNAALLQKEILSEQLEQTNEKVKALRNLLAGIQLGKELVEEQNQQTQPVTDG